MAPVLLGWEAMLTTTRCGLLIGCLLLGFALQASAKNLYVHAGATGANNGSDWNNAWKDFASIKWGTGAGQLGAGDTLWIAGGTYVDTLYPAASGTDAKRLFIKRATSQDSECTLAAGWKAAYDSQVVIDRRSAGFGIFFRAGHDIGSFVTVDGQVRDGIKILIGDSAQGIRIRKQVHNTTFRNIHIKGPGGDINNRFPFTISTRGVHVLADNYGNVNNTHFERLTIEGVCTAYHIQNMRGLIIENCDIFNIWTASDTHPNIAWTANVSNVHFRYNDIRDYSAEGYFIMTMSAGHKSENVHIYGNSFRDGAFTARAVEVKPNIDPSHDRLYQGPIFIYNNTFVNLWQSIRMGSEVDPTTTSHAFNNLMFNAPGTFKNLQLQNNLLLTGNENDGNNLFRNYSTRDLRLKAPRGPGVTLNAPFNTDGLQGIGRANDGFWDVGAYEFNSGGTQDTQPPVISNIQVTHPTASSARISWQTDENADGQVAYGKSTSLGSVVSTTGSLATAHAVVIENIESGTTYYFRVRSTDGSGNVGLSALETFTSSASLDQTPPEVRIQLPSADQILRGEARLEAHAVDPDGSGVAQVVFYGNDQLIGSGLRTTGDMFTFTWNTLRVQNGVYAITARAVDREGNGATSAAMQTLVHNTLPDLRANLVGYWALDAGSGTEAFDSSGNGRHGRLVNGAAWVDGLLREAVQLNGSQHVDLGDFSVTGDQMTLAAWFKATSLPPQDPRIIAKATSRAAADMNWMLEVDDGTPHRLGVRLNTGNETLRLSGGVVVPGEWIHVAGVYDGLNLRLYQNGEEVAEESISGPIRAGNAPVWIGANPGATDRHFRGLIDDVRVYNRVLTEPELQALVRARTPATPGGLRAESH